MTLIHQLRVLKANFKEHISENKWNRNAKNDNEDKQNFLIVATNLIGV